MVDGKDDVTQGNREQRRRIKNQIEDNDLSDAHLAVRSAVVPPVLTSLDIRSSEDPHENSSGEIKKDRHFGNQERSGEGSNRGGYRLAFLEACVVLSSDSEVELCRCVKQSEQCFENVMEMNATDHINCPDSDFYSKHSDSDSGSTSSSEYLQPEEESDTATKEERNLERSSDSEIKNRKRRIGARRRRERAITKQAIVMEASEDHEVIAECLLANDKGEGTTKRCTRGSQKLSGKKRRNEVGRVEISGKKPLGSKKISKKESGTLLTKRGRKKVSPAVVEAIFGNLQSCVPDAQELSRKRDEDAMKCGWKPRIVGDGVKSTVVHQKVGSHNEVGVGKQLENHDPTHEFPSSDQAFRPRPFSTEEKCIGEVGEELEDHLVSSRSYHEGLQVNEMNIHSQFLTTKATNRTSAVDVIEECLRKGKSVANEDHPVRLPLGLTGNSRSPSPVAYRDNKHSGRSHSREEGSPPEVRGLPHERSYDSMSGSRWGHPPSTDEGMRSNSRRRNRSRSPRLGQRVHLTTGDPLEFQVYKSRNQVSPRGTPGSGARSFEELEDRGRRRSKDSPSTFNSQRYRRSFSPCSSLERGNGRSSFEKNKSPSTSLLRGPFQSAEANYNALGSQMKEDMHLLSLSDDRRRRRHKQSFRESQKIQRQSEGKKPFHLIVNSEGIPYGPGRPAWVGQINKLAKWLDPSCTDIRRQAHGDICIFKERLNENFEYSGDLNEDYLRSLMGKAVTRRRTDIISLINMGGSCPPLMDVKLWKRLELLAASKQRERRSKHGRFANSCRRTLGRTGVSGEEGIRERLREMFGRSPDPHEVGEEMERDKGYGKCKEGMSLQQSHHRHEVSGEVRDNENKRQQSHSSEMRQRRSYDDDSRMQESSDNVCSKALKSKEASGGGNCEPTAGIPEGRQLICGSEGKNVTRKYTKDEHIARLEAELERLRGYQGKSSSMIKDNSRGQWSPGNY